MTQLKVNTISKQSGNNISMNCALNLKNLSSDPSSGNAAGDIYYNTTTNKANTVTTALYNLKQST